ncbi:MAG: FAD/NAD(P)-binding protein [Jatrophihabitans sp.]|uniref:FAD/NAD(P)-binding protein n=1 Tax=Jatrophihabitans sp. TaxID=1932789 RepID=UPI003F7EEA99
MSDPPPSPRMITRPSVAVIGGGASGSLTVAQLARCAARTGATVDILLIAPEQPDQLGRGVAYGTDDHRHRLNVPAAKMSAWPHDPQHFLDWLHRHHDADFPAGGFAPRAVFGDYLQDCLDEAIRSTTVRVELVTSTATDVRRHGRRLRISLGDGSSRAADAAVLAIGAGRPAATWAPAALRRSDVFVADPWAADLPPADGDVLLVGTGLTMLDMAMTHARAGRRVHVLSRTGLLPVGHAARPSAPVPPPTLPDQPTAASVRALIDDHIAACGGDWRQAIDSLRGVTTTLWRKLSDECRAELLRTDGRRWNQARHRADAELTTWLQQRLDRGEVVAHRGEITGAQEVPGAVEVTLSDGSRLTVGRVVNCTGPDDRLATRDDALVLNLLASGMVRPGPLGLGVACEIDGRVIAGDGFPSPVWAMGALRKGELWETTAIPEIRVQAGVVARQVLAALPQPELRRRARDPFGLPITASGEASTLYIAALDRILRVQSGAETLVARAVAADPGFALGHAVQALLGAEWGCDVDVATALAAAERAGTTADERERRFIEVAAQRVRAPGAESAAALLSYIQAYPEDALAVSLAVPTIAFGGATELPTEAWALSEGLAPVYGEHWWYLSMLAFIRQEQDRFDEAADLAQRALSIEPGSGHAVHAKAHVHYETGDHAAGLAWLDGWIDRCGARASHRAHFSWHAALHELALGDTAAVTRRYAAQLAPPQVSGVRALVDSASLLWRLHVHGHDAADVRPVLRTVEPELLANPPTAFTALHAAMALAAAHDCQGLTRVRRMADRRGGEVFETVIAPFADALLDLVHGDPDRAADGLVALLDHPALERVGGSAAQREVVEDTALHCAVEAGRSDVAQQLLQHRLQRRPSRSDTALLATLTAPRAVADR